METPIRLQPRLSPPSSLLLPDPTMPFLPWEALLLVSRGTVRKMKLSFKGHWPLRVIPRSPLQGETRARDKGGCVGGSPYECPALLGHAPTAGPTPPLQRTQQQPQEALRHRQCERRKRTFLQSEVENKSQKRSSVSWGRLGPDHLCMPECHACHLLAWALLSCSHPQLPFPHLQNGGWGVRM